MPDPGFVSRAMSRIHRLRKLAAVRWLGSHSKRTVVALYASSLLLLPLLLLLMSLSERHERYVKKIWRAWR